MSLENKIVHVSFVLLIVCILASLVSIPVVLLANYPWWVPLIPGSVFTAYMMALIVAIEVYGFVSRTYRQIRRG